MLFANIRGSTSLAEKMSAAEWRLELKGKSQSVNVYILKDYSE